MTSPDQEITSTSKTAPETQETPKNREKIFTNLFELGKRYFVDHLNQITWQWADVGWSIYPVMTEPVNLQAALEGNMPYYGYTVSWMISGTLNIDPEGLKQIVKEVTIKLTHQPSSSSYVADINYVEAMDVVERDDAGDRYTRDNSQEYSKILTLDDTNNLNSLEVEMTALKDIARS